MDSHKTHNYYCENMAAAKAQKTNLCKSLTLALPLIETRGFTRETVNTSVTVTALLDPGAEDEFRQYLSRSLKALKPYLEVMSDDNDNSMAKFYEIIEMSFYVPSHSRSQSMHGHHIFTRYQSRIITLGMMHLRRREACEGSCIAHHYGMMAW
ncbi:hypothetical protein DFH29DRAFT_41771 [Suillus ampliporus]|nr:hypothetical protein DFH29DRAFT_41771 [Suillus ampliporus]